MYYVSKVLTKTEMNYLKVQKYLYALVISARKLHPYFQEHEIIETFPTKTLRFRKDDKMSD